MEKIQSELMELVETGYDYEATMNLGNGWEAYEGCHRNLVMILEDPDTRVILVEDDSALCKPGIRRYHIVLPSWWRPGMIALEFDQQQL